MSNFGRTKENRKRLKLKSFFKRLIRPFLIIEIKNLNQENSKLNGVIGSGISYQVNKILGKTYTLKSLNEYVYRRCEKVFKWKQQKFNKQQLTGKIIVEGKKQFRII